MNRLPQYRPRQLSLGPLEAELLQIIWEQGAISAGDIHDRILTDPDRELAYGSVMTVLRRLEQKGWVQCEKQGRTLLWQARVTSQEAQSLQAYDRLNRFLAIGDADIVAAFANDLDHESIDKLGAIAQRLQSLRDAREQAHSQQEEG